jgi:hypothetical protein
MAILDIVFKSRICFEENRGSGVLGDIVCAKDIEPCCEENRGDIGVIFDIFSIQPPLLPAITFVTQASIDDVRFGVQYGNDGTQFTGTLVVGGATSCFATLEKNTDHAKGGSGTCAKLTPTSTASSGYWHFYIPVISEIPFVFSFWHQISTAWNGTLKVTIYDTDQITPLLSSESVSLIDDGQYHQHFCTQCTPSTVGMCLIRIEIQDGTNTGYVYIDDIGAV